MKLSVIIPTKDRKEILRTTLSAAIRATAHLNSEIVIVNDSKTGTPEKPNAKNVILLNNPKSGVAAARNFGFENTTGELILFLDNDIIISKDSVNHILNFHKSNPAACLNLNWEYTTETLDEMSSFPFTRFLKTFGMTSFKGWYNDPSWKEDQLFLSKSVASFHLSISRANFLKAGGYNEQFPFAGFEDYDFPVRLKKTGTEFYIDSRVTVFHNEIDRLDLDNWLNHQQNRASTRKKAVGLGYDELALEYRFLKRIMLGLIMRNERLFKMILKMMPNTTVIDPLYFKMLSALQASRIYRGYMLS